MEKGATKNVQLVLQHYCKTSWIALLHILPPKSNLSWNRWVKIKMRNIAIQVLLKQNCKTSCTLMWKWINQHVISGIWEIIGSNSVRGLRFFLCSTLLTCWLIHFHICFTKLKIYHLSFFHHTVWHRYRWSLQYTASVLIWT